MSVESTLTVAYNESRYPGGGDDDATADFHMSARVNSGYLGEWLLAFLRILRAAGFDYVANIEVTKSNGGRIGVNADTLNIYDVREPGEDPIVVCGGEYPQPQQD